MRKSALLISCGTYVDRRLHPLPSSIPDCARFADLLERPNLGGFNVNIVNDPNLVTVQRELHDTLAQAEADDLVLIYLSSHGLKDMFGRFYLALPETDLSALPATALSGRYIREQINDTSARKLVIVLDSCFSGAFGRELVAKAVSVSDGTPDELTEGTGHAILAASSPIQYALEDGAGSAPTSVFTRAICDGIVTGAADIDADGWISLSDLFEYSSKEVSDRYPLQTPQMSCFGLDRDLRLLRAPSSPVIYSEFDADIEEGAKSIHPELRIATVTILGRIAHSQNRDRASSALRKLRSIRDDYHPEVKEAIEYQIAHAPKKPRRRVPVQNAEDKKVHSREWVEVSAEQLSRASQAAAHFVDKSGEFEQLGSVHFVANDIDLKVWATDRYRVDFWNIATRAHGEGFVASIPGSDVYSLKVFPKKSAVRMEVGEEFTEFECKEKLLSMPSVRFGKLVDYERLIADSFSMQLYMARAPFLDALERSISATKARWNSAVTFDLNRSGKDLLEVSFADEGKVIESLPVKRVGERIKMAFNPHFVVSALASFSSASIKFNVTHPEKPLLITADDEPEHRHLLMPVRLSR
ncbi:caspase family protein [Streptomyces caniferus]|uniref:caspase family protein n=1 Tax=Streptomyces caniferus TaxID=285557 RepID=UPI002E289560|nr:caspase family protein [Streptomyces caniferus]